MRARLTQGMIVLGAIVVAASPVAASPLELFGFGTRSPAGVGTGVASATDFEAVYANPAGLAHARVRTATVGAITTSFDLHLNDVHAPVDRSGGLVFGASLPLPLGGVARDRVGLGLGFYVPNSAVTRVQAPFPGEPSFALLQNRTHVVALQIGVGVKLTERWSVGAGVLALAKLGGTIDVRADSSGAFTTRSEQQLLARYAPVVGARYAMAPAWQLGATWRAPSRSDYEIVVTSDLGDAIPLTLPTILIAGNAQYDPMALAVEAHHQRGPTSVALQLAWQRWSAMPLPTINPVAGTPPQQPADFHDTVVPRLAVQHQLTLGAVGLEARAGYAFHLSPAPEMRGQQSLLDNHRHVVGLGLGATLAGWPIRLDLFAQAHVLMARTHRKDPTLQPEPVGPDVLRTTGQVWVGGLSMGVTL